jgi:type VI secretion system secreted protein VgrG
MGDHSIKVSMGQSTIEAMQSITLKVGANSIKIDQTGITLDGIMISITGQAQTQVTASGIVQITGGIVTINS